MQAHRDDDETICTVPGDGAPRAPRRRWAWTAALVALLCLGGVAVPLAPDLLGTSLNANEAAVIATLKNVSSAQSQCQASGVIDQNGNGAGEYGYFRELSGSAPLRGSTACVAVPMLSPAFGQLLDGCVRRSGYRLRMYLPDRHGAGVAEGEHGEDGAAGGRVDPGQAEVLWCCYAWPERRGRSGGRTFFVNQSGDVLATNDPAGIYGGDSAVSPDAAFARSSGRAMGAAVAANTVGCDGNVWVVI